MSIINWDDYKHINSEDLLKDMQDYVNASRRTFKEMKSRHRKEHDSVYKEAKRRIESHKIHTDSQLQSSESEKSQEIFKANQIMQSSIVKLNEGCKVFEDTKRRDINDLSNKILQTRTKSDYDILSIKDIKKKVIDIRTSLEIGNNAKLFFEIEKEDNSASYMKNGDVKDIDFDAINRNVADFNSEVGIFKRKDALEHGKYLCGFIQWASKQCDTDIEKIISETELYCKQLEEQKKPLEAEITKKRDNNKICLDSIKNDNKKRIYEIERNYSRRIEELRNSAMTIKSNIEANNSVDIDRINSQIVNEEKDCIQNIINGFSKRYPPELVKKYIYYHTSLSLGDLDKYSCASNYPESYEIGMLIRNGEDFYFIDEFKEFLIKEYSLIFSNEAIRLPYSFSYTQRKNVCIQYHASNDEKIMHHVQYLMMNVLLASPAAGVNFAFIDPLKSTNTFAPFNKFVDRNNGSMKLLTGGIATKQEAINEKLLVINEHIENVISTRLQSNDMTIQEYNRLAGANAEPYIYLTIMDFPVGFTAETVKRLERIIESGPRCGVYTTLLVSKEQLGNADKTMRNLIENVNSKAYHFDFDGETFGIKEFSDTARLKLNDMFADRALDEVVPIYREAYKRAGRVIVGFEDIIVPRDEWIRSDSRNGIEIPIGLIGVNNPQHFSLGAEGVSHHALIAGGTGSGKTTLLHTLVTNGMLKYGNDELEIFMVDFKRGVEFKIYGDYNLPGVKLVAIESNRKFGYDVLERIEREQERRAAMFKECNCVNIAQYRDKTGEKMPRILLIMDEYHELFNSSTSDYISTESSEMLHRVLAQGRAFGIHVILATQNVELSSLNSSIYDLVAVRIALACSSSEAGMILGESSDEAKLLQESGMAIYSHNLGNKNTCSLFRVGYITGEKQSDILEDLSKQYLNNNIKAQTQVISSNNQAKEELNNNYIERCQFSYPERSVGRRKRVVVPFAVDDDNNLFYCDFEGMNFASYIMGAAGSGKSVLLDTIIAGLTMNYHPDEMELWMMDFMKTGFAKYTKNPMPHIKYIMLGNEEEYAFQMLDRLEQELERRKKLFSSEGRHWENITEVDPSVHLPYIFLIVDEFGRMLQIISETAYADREKNYVTKLENLLAEGRKLGFKFIFANQSYSSDTKGLSSKSKEQIGMRLALANTKEEIKETLELAPQDSSELINSWISSLPAYKTLIKRKIKDENGNDKVIVNKVNNLRLESESILENIAKINEYFSKGDDDNSKYVEKNVSIVVDTDMASYDSKIKEFEEMDAILGDEDLRDDPGNNGKYDDYDDDDIVLFPGSAKGFNKTMPVFLHKDSCENMLVFGGETAGAASVLLTMIKRCKCQGVSCSIWTDSRNLIYRKQFKKIFDENVISKGIDEVCASVNNVRNKNNTKDEVIFVLGYRNLSDEFDLYDGEEYGDVESISEKTENMKAEDVHSVFESYFEEWKQSLANESVGAVKKQDADKGTDFNDNGTAVVEKEEKIVYDARNDINILLKQGSRRGKHFVFCFENYNDYKSLRMDERLFRHKVLLSMNQEFATNIGEKSAEKLSNTELLYVANSVKQKYRILLHKEIPFAGLRVDEDGNVIDTEME